MKRLIGPIRSPLFVSAFVFVSASCSIALSGAEDSGKALTGSGRIPPLPWQLKQSWVLEPVSLERQLCKSGCSSTGLSLGSGAGSDLQELTKMRSSRRRG